MSHPAKYSKEVLEAFTSLLGVGYLDLDRHHVHDPFAGTGERLGAWCDEHDMSFSGTELEPEFIVDPRVVQGDATDPNGYPDGGRLRWAVVTSPVYPNGMADHFHSTVVSKRHTYRQGLADINGYDRPLDPRNMGRYSYRGGGRSKSVYWGLAEDAIRCWRFRRADLVVLNVSDFIMKGEVVHLANEWCEAMEADRWYCDYLMRVPTKRQRHGANGDLRVDHEEVTVWTPR